MGCRCPGQAANSLAYSSGVSTRSGSWLSLGSLTPWQGPHARNFSLPGLTGGKHSTLTNTDQQRPAIILAKTCYKLDERVSAALATQPQEAPEIKILDATTIELCAAVFPWGKFRTRTGVVRLHAVLTGLLPKCVRVNDGKTHDRQAVPGLHFEPGALLIFDRACLDYAGSTGCTKKASGS